MSKNLHLLSAGKLTKKLIAKKVKAIDIAESCVEQVKKEEPRIRAWKSARSAGAIGLNPA